MAMVGNIFISYRRGADSGMAGRLFDHLERTFGRQRIFIDVDSISPGEDFVSVLEQWVAQCDVMLVLIGRRWFTAADETTGRRRLDNPCDFVRIEIALALNQGKLVIPVLLDDEAVPRLDELPEELKPLVRRQFMRLRQDSFRADSQRLIYALEKILAHAELSAPLREESARPAAVGKIKGRVSLLALIQRMIYALKRIFAVAEKSARSEAEAEVKDRISRLARIAASEPDLAQLDEHIERLPEGSMGVLKDVPKLRSMVQEIAQLQRRLKAVQQPAFQELMAEQLITKIENFWHRVGGLKEPLASEYRVAALEWQARAEEQLNDIRSVRSRARTVQVFRAGDPVDRSNEAFVPRMRAIDLLERQIMLAQGCPGLLVYGRRRVGKSTLLINLNEFLPPSVRVAIVSMQNPHAFASPGSFARLLLQSAWAALGKDPAVTLPETLSEMFTALKLINEHLVKNNERMMLACDEFEMIDYKIGEKIFSVDLLHTLRESIQTHRRIIWAFVGSHSLDELVHANWASYFVSLRTVEVTQFTLEETHLLLTEPLKYSPLWKDRLGATPRFTSFWAQDGIKRIYAETGGWPHLVQLVAETCVDLANDKGADAIDAALLEHAFEEAVRRGDTVLRQLIEGESYLRGEEEYLLGFREREAQAEPNDPLVRRALRRRQIVVSEDGTWHLRVPLMRRWITANG